LAAGFVCLLSLLSYPFTPESIRWLAQNGRKEEALELLAEATKENRKGREMTSRERERAEEVLTDVAEVAADHSEKKLHSLDLFRGGYLTSSLVQVIKKIRKKETMEKSKINNK